MCRLGWCPGAGHSCSIVARRPGGTTEFVPRRPCRSPTDGTRQGLILLYSSLAVRFRESHLCSVKMFRLWHSEQRPPFTDFPRVKHCTKHLSLTSRFLFIPLRGRCFSYSHFTHTAGERGSRQVNPTLSPHRAARPTASRGAFRVRGHNRLASRPAEHVFPPFHGERRTSGGAQGETPVWTTPEPVLLLLGVRCPTPSEGGGGERDRK